MNKQIKIVLIVLVIFTLVSVSITYTLIKNSTSNVCQENTNGQEISFNQERGIDLYGTYNENDLLIEDLIETFSGEKIKIPQVNGLKNKQIEYKINQEIYDICNKCIQDTTENIAEFFEIYSAYDVMANFSNIISINYYLNVNGNMTHIYLNYNLTTGEKLKLEDVFVKDADILEIVRNAFRENLSNYSYSFEFIDDNGVAIFDENELYKIVKGYMNTEEKEFMISPSEIYFYFNNSGASVKLLEIADEISIYTKYLTDESIYENNDIGRKNIFTLVKTNYDLFDIIDYGYLEDNFWYDVTVSKMYFPDGQVETEKMERFNAYAKTLTNEAYDKVNEYREIAKANPDKFYILICTPNVSMYNDSKYENGEWTYTYSNMAISNLNTKVYEMPLELYNSKYKDKIIDAYRNNYFVMRGGMYYSIEEPDSGDSVTYNKEEKTIKYNYMTNEEIKQLSEIFNEDVNYMEILEKKVKRELIEYYEYAENEAEELMKSAEYDFKGWDIKVDIPQLKNFRYTMHLSTFDKLMLNIFDKED